MYLSQAEITGRIDALSSQINSDYEGRCPLFIMVLKGAFMFGTELIRRFAGPCEVQFIRAKSYVGMASSGEINIEANRSILVEKRDVILIEDIVDSGKTLSKLIPLLEKRNPSSLRLASLLFKPEALQHDVHISYCGFEIPNKFVVGYGLDYDELGRNYPAIYALKE